MRGRNVARFAFSLALEIRTEIANQWHAASRLVAFNVHLVL